MCADMLPLRQSNRPGPEGQGDRPVRHRHPQALHHPLFPRPGPRTCCGGELLVYGVYRKSADFHPDPSEGFCSVLGFQIYDWFSMGQQ